MGNFTFKFFKFLKGSKLKSSKQWTFYTTITDCSLQSLPTMDTVIIRVLKTTQRSPALPLHCRCDAQKNGNGNVFLHCRNNGNENGNVKRKLEKRQWQGQWKNSCYIAANCYFLLHNHNLYPIKCVFSWNSTFVDSLITLHIDVVLDLKINKMWPEKLYFNFWKTLIVNRVAQKTGSATATQKKFFGQWKTQWQR